MTPEDLQLIESDAGRVTDEADAFATVFYSTLFELDPSARRLFTTDMAEQRRKLTDELAVLVGLGLEASRSGLDGFERRAGALGRRHRRYGVTSRHYDTVGVALLAALRRRLPDWNDERERAWTRLYTLVADVM